MPRRAFPEVEDDDFSLVEDDDSGYWFEDCYSMDSDKWEIGCLFPGECCMPGMHYTHECHTAEMAEQWYEENADPPCHT
jgi:hypothetical protein